MFSQVLSVFCFSNSVIFQSSEGMLFFSFSMIVWSFSYFISAMRWIFSHACNHVYVESAYFPLVILYIHYANTPMQYTAIFHGCKNVNFQIKIIIFFSFLLKTLIVGTR